MTARLANQARILVAAVAALCLLAGLFAAGSSARADENERAATIEFLNPSTGSSLKISDKQAKDQTFALSAWVSGPAVELVEFELSSVNPIARATTIGAGTLVAPDTYELQWSVPQTLADGRYTLSAIAYGRSGESYAEIDRDEETVTLLSAAETIDITAPSRDGSLGMYVPDGRPAGGAIDTVQSLATGFVRVFYTTARPGTEPVWKPCGFEPTKKAADGAACVLGATDRPSAVTAISTVANSTPYMDAQGKDTGREQPDPAADQTADAARISTYKQIPTAVTLNPPTERLNANSRGEYPCSGVIKAVVTDQNGKGILGANVDVHAGGPTNGVYFEVVGLVSKNQAPDKNHGGTENGYNCTGTPTDSTEKEGVHRVPGGLSIKHVESEAKGGTDSAGVFSFRVFSEAGGTSSITAWMDVTDDDRFCVGEPAGLAMLGWGQDAAAGELEEAETGCTDKVSRSIALESSATKITRGQKVQLVGAITSEEPGCVAGQRVRLQSRKPQKGTRFRTIATRRTTEVGVYRFSVAVRRSTVYRAVTPANEMCAKARSLPVRVRALK